ncbi:MAG: hypothetical protein KF893_14315 [Caldilineaceae bacterium]|nr:hypothetical protein [Caldilineaceae bacterium]
MNDLFDTSLNDFYDEMQRVEQLLTIVDGIRQLAGTPPDLDEEGITFIDTARDLHIKVRNSPTEIPILSGTLLLYIVGRFENFVRISFETLCDLLAEKCKKFSDLPEKMQSTLISQTAEVLVRPSRYGFDTFQVQTFVVNLAKNMEAENGVGQINSACLSITEQNLRPNLLADLYKRVGIPSLWSELAKQSQLKLFFEDNADQRVEAAAKALLEELMNIRNQIAHPSTIPTFPDTIQVRRHIKYLKVLASVLIDICKVHYTTHKPK